MGRELRKVIPNFKHPKVETYETVSEGTPITPPFETKEELVEWMSNNKDFWGYQWTKEQAENFVINTGWAMSGIIKNGEIKKGYEVINEQESIKNA